MEYWFSHFIGDYIKYIIVGLITYAFMFIFQINTLVSSDKAFVVFVFICVYGVNFIMFVYAVSFYFSSPSSG